MQVSPRPRGVARGDRTQSAGTDIRQHSWTRGLAWTHGATWWHRVNPQLPARPRQLCPIDSQQTGATGAAPTHCVKGKRLIVGTHAFEPRRFETGGLA
jgi:hypothetical protein